MFKNRLFQHLSFWLVFYSISLYNELYLSPSFTVHPSLNLLLQSMASLALLYVIKIVVAYTFLYRIIPHWIGAKTKTVYYVQAIGLLLCGTLLMRLATQEIVWKYIYEEVAPGLTGKQVVARYFYSFLELLQITAIAISIKLFKLRVSAVQKEKQLVQEKLGAEMQHLRSQTNPHFLFNTLNSIFALSRSKSEQTPDAVMKLSKILRYMLYETSYASKPIRDELAVIEDYIQLQQIRFGDRIHTDIQTKLDDPNAAIAPLLLLPLIENAYKHSNQAEALISLHIELNNAKLRVSVTNPVAEVSVPDEGQEGIGLGNIRRQLELLYKSFNLIYGEENGIFIVTLEIDLSSYAETELFDTGR